MSEKEEIKVLISAAPLRQILQALVGAPHLIRELQALSGGGIEKLTGKLSPITQVLEEFNAEVRRLNGETPTETTPAPAPAAPPAEPEQSALPGVSDGFKRQSIVFYDARLQDDCNEFAPGTVVASPLVFGEHNLSLAGGLFPKELAKENYGWTDQDTYEPTFEILGFLLDLGYGTTTHTVYLPAPGKGTIIDSNTDSISAFKYNKTIEYKGRLFTIETLLGFNPATGELRATAVNLNADCPTRKIGEAFGITEDIQTARLAGLSFRVVRRIRQD